MSDFAWASIYVVVIFHIPSTHHLAQGSLLASTILNSTLKHASNIQNPIINTRKFAVSEHDVHSSTQSHGCCKNESSLQNSTASPDSFSTQGHHKLDDVKLATMKFIEEEKSKPPRESSKTINAETENSTLIGSQSNDYAVQKDLQSNLDLSTSTVKSVGNVNNTLFLEGISNEPITEEDGKATSWIHSPMLHKTLKFLVTEFYPEKILNSLPDRLKFFNGSVNGGAMKPSVVYPLVMEGVSVLLNRITESGSRENENHEETQGTIKGKIANIMVNSIDKLQSLNDGLGRLVGFDESNQTKEKSNDTTGDLMNNSESVNNFLPLFQSVLNNKKYSYVLSNIVSKPQNDLGKNLKTLLQNYGSPLNNTGIVSFNQTNQNHTNEQIDVLRGLKDLLPLVREAQKSGILSNLESTFLNKPLNELGDENGILSGLLNNKRILNAIAKQTLGKDSSGNESGIDKLMNLYTSKSLMPMVNTLNRSGVLSDIVSTFLNQPSNEVGNMSEQNGSNSSGILNYSKLFGAIANRSSKHMNASDLMNIMAEYMPKNKDTVSGDVSPKNPLLRSEFMSKMLSKSPVAHLGALDDDIKKLVMSSLERALSRVKIDQNGQPQISEGMKMIARQIQQGSDFNITDFSSMSAINGILQSVIEMSGSANVTGDAPMGRRNVTKHSHLHQKFIAKYGKDPRILKSTSSSSSMLRASLILVVLLIPINIRY